MHLAVVLHAEKVLMRTGLHPEHTFTLARNCSAALAASIAERLRTVLSASAPCTVLTTYAMTECVPICSNPRDGVQKLDSVGPPAGPEVNILLNDSTIKSLLWSFQKLRKLLIDGVNKQAVCWCKVHCSMLK